MDALTAWWHRVGYLLFPSHQKELDNINKMILDLKGELERNRIESLTLKREVAASLLAADALKARLQAAEAAHQRPPMPQKAKTAAEVRRLAEQAAQTEGEGDGV